MMRSSLFRSALASWPSFVYSCRAFQPSARDFDARSLAMRGLVVLPLGNILRSWQQADELAKRP
eukprot:617229-Prymnesium_polylepis.1